MPGREANSTSHKQAAMADGVKNRRPRLRRDSLDEPDMLATPSLPTTTRCQTIKNSRSSQTPREGSDAVLVVRRMLAQDVGFLRPALRS